MWGLTDDEHDLAEYIYYETKGSIFVDSNGDLHEDAVSSSERIDSQQCYAFDIFIGEIENAKLRAQNKIS
jgi:hypothetical protein